MHDFFASLHHAKHLGIPGAVNNMTERQQMTHKLPHIRYKVFIFGIRREINRVFCLNARVSHYICILNRGNIGIALKQKPMFLNKFHADYEPEAYACLEQYLYQKNQKELM